MKASRTRFQIVQIALFELPRFQQQAVGIGPGGRRLVGRFAAVEDIVFVLSANGLKGQPAEIARPDLQHAGRDDFVLADDDHVFAVGRDFAVMQKFRHDHAVRFAGGDGYGPLGVVFHAAFAKSLGGGGVVCHHEKNSAYNNQD